MVLPVAGLALVAAVVPPGPRGHEAGRRGRHLPGREPGPGVAVLQRLAERQRRGTPTSTATTARPPRTPCAHGFGRSVRGDHGRCGHGQAPAAPAPGRRPAPEPGPTPRRGAAERAATRAASPRATPVHPAAGPTRQAEPRRSRAVGDARAPRRPARRGRGQRAMPPMMPTPSAGRASVQSGARAAMPCAWSRTRQDGQQDGGQVVEGQQAAVPQPALGDDDERHPHGRGHDGQEDPARSRSATRGPRPPGPGRRPSAGRRRAWPGAAGTSRSSRAGRRRGRAASPSPCRSGSLAQVEGPHPPHRQQPADHQGGRQPADAVGQQPQGGGRHGAPGQGTARGSYPACRAAAQPPPAASRHGQQGARQQAEAQAPGTTSAGTGPPRSPRWRPAPRTPG